MPPARVALVTSPISAGPGWGAVVGDHVREAVPIAQLPQLVSRIEAEHSPRWVWWAAQQDAAAAVAAGVDLAKAFDLAEAHRLLHGGWPASPGRVWAGAHGLPLERVPKPSRGDLFDFAARADGLDDSLVQGDGHLRPDLDHWLIGPERLLAWADLALQCAARICVQAEHTSSRLLPTIHSESAAALLCVELERDGLPIDRTAMEGLIAAAAGPRSVDPADEAAARRERDAAVLALVPGHTADLRNPAQVRELLAAIGIDVPTTRKWVLEAYREVHPVIGALLAWRRAERIATTYGYRWLDTHVGPDDRLRGHWSACDGAAGRMTAENGLHNLPVSLRSGVAAHEGQVFVRADLGQIEPRVLAAVSGDPAFAQASRADDLYAPVAARLGVDRPTAKIAVLAAMYGQRSGAAGQALKGLQAAYPSAMALLDSAYAAGQRGEPLRTFGGRLVPTGRFLAERPPGTERALDAARGRFARNAIIQGAAAELFKAWAATVRATTADLGAQIVLALHDELLVQVPREQAPETADRVRLALDDAARRWTGAAPVRFVADISIIERWSQAKD